MKEGRDHEVAGVGDGPEDGAPQRCGIATVPVGEAHVRARENVLIVEADAAQPQQRR